MKPVIHFVDDDASFRTATTRLLRAGGYDVVPYASAREFLSTRRDDAPGCLLVDLQMPEMDGMDLVAELALTADPLPVVFLTAHGDIPTSVRAIKRGAEDFLVKTASRDELFAAVDRALARSIAETLTRRQQRELHRRLETLTVREREVLAGVVKGKLNKEIAAELGIHERTVKLHRTSLTHKLDVHSVAGLTLLARESGILP